MDQTAIQPGSPHAKPAENGLHIGPPGGANGTAAPTPAAKSRTKTPVVRVLETLASLRITVVLFVMSMILVFWGTLAQVDNGVWTIVNQYFRSFVLLVPLKVVMLNLVDNTDIVIPYPGGWLIGSAMLVNLLAAHAIRFRLAWNRVGIPPDPRGADHHHGGGIRHRHVSGRRKHGHPGRTKRQLHHSCGANRKVGLSSARSAPRKTRLLRVPASFLKNGKVVEDEKTSGQSRSGIQYMVNSDLVDDDREKKNPDMKGFWP